MGSGKRNGFHGFWGKSQRSTRAQRGLLSFRYLRLPNDLSELKDERKATIKTKKNIYDGSVRCKRTDISKSQIPPQRQMVVTHNRRVGLIATGLLMLTIQSFQLSISSVICSIIHFTTTQSTCLDLVGTDSKQ